MSTYDDSCSNYRAQVDSFLQLCFRGAKITPAERFLWLTLHFHVFDNGGEPVSLTYEQLCDRSGMRSTATLKRALHKLQKMGLITINKGSGRTCSAYGVAEITEGMLYGEAFARPEPEMPEPVFRTPAQGEPVLSRSQSPAGTAGGFSKLCTEIKEFYNSNRNRMKEFRVFDSKRKRLLREALNDYTPDQIKEAILKASESDWLNGKGKKKGGNVDWCADFEWLLNNIGRILDGGYDNGRVGDSGEAPDFLDRVAAGFGEGLFGDFPALDAPGGLL